MLPKEDDVRLRGPARSLGKLGGPGDVGCDAVPGAQERCPKAPVNTARRSLWGFGGLGPVGHEDAQGVTWRTRCFWRQC